METTLIKIDENSENLENELKYPAEILRNGGLVVFPTETVYGLGADATSEGAAEKIYRAKGRPSDNPLIVHISDISDAEKYAYTNDVYYKLAANFMPGPLTLIMASKESIPKKTRGGLNTVAIRCPENKIANTLIRLSGIPIAAPSANLSGSPSPTVAEHVIDDMQGRVDVIIDGGNSDFGLESTILMIDNPEEIVLLRPGKITVSEIEDVVGKIKIADAVTGALKEGEKVLSPGMKYRHYAPKAELMLLDGNNQQSLRYIRGSLKENIAVLAYKEDVSYFKENLPAAEVYSFGNKNNKSEQAHNLFLILREMDKKNFDVIYAPLPSKEGIGLALYNRMIRAAAHKIVTLKDNDKERS